MSLHGRKIDQSPVRHRPFFGEYPQRISEEDMPRILELVRKCDKDAMDQMAVGHIRLAISIVNRYISVYNLKYYAHELDSAAFEGIVVAVSKIASGKLTHDNATGYIVKYTHQYVSNCARNSSVVRFPRTAKRRSIEPLPNEILGKSETDMIDAWDLVENISTNDTEKRILKLKIEGCTDFEIGAQLGLSRLKVLRIRGNLLKRYQKKERTSV